MREGNVDESNAVSQTGSATRSAYADGRMDAISCAERVVQPKVSVLVPVYRTNPAFLREAIQSVLSQTYPDFELILLDDCPDDPREDVVREFADPRIRYERNERNLGISPSRNRLIDMARGEYLAIFDHDDVSHPTRLEKEVAYLDAHPECGVVSSWVREIPSGKIVRRVSDDESIRLDLMGGNIVPHTAAMIRAAVLKESGIRYEEAFSPSEDYRLVLRLVPHTRFHILAEPLLDYRLYAGNTSKVQSGRMERSAALAQEAARDENPALFAAYRRLSKSVTVYRLFGVPVLRVETLDRRTCVKLFCAFTILTVKRSRKPVAAV